MDLLGIRLLPFLSRRNFVYELRQIALWGVLAGLVEGQFASIVIAKIFDGSDWLIAIASATPLAANLFSLAWGVLCVGRSKIRLATVFATLTALCTGAVAAIPNSPSGAIWFMIQMAAAQILMTGVVTSRTALWRYNYPRSERGRITARLQGVRFVISALTALSAAWLCDWSSSAYRWICPVAAIVGLASLGFLCRIHVRRERHEIRPLRSPSGVEDLRPWLFTPAAAAVFLWPGRIFRTMWEVLRDDRKFRRYCLAQMFIGLANLMTIAIVVSIVTRELLPEGDKVFWISIVLLEVLPRAVTLGTLGRWGGVFDRHGVLGMRRINVICWIFSFTFGFLGDWLTPVSGVQEPMFFLLAVWALAIRGLARGMAMGGAAVAWFIGHLHFSENENAEVYLGVHVFLAGFRGLVAPLAGMFLWHLVGWPVWGIAVALSLMALWVFSSLHRDELKNSKNTG